ncbi:uncharacterized protein LOC108466065 [Gossypium arboreum]|uniref:uncharacterized protein LOC108466065 n=1 Tax=Gossypium arboreum TaxID=29729 RepID=UPI00081911A8|nr:uncharacterized protein LOC108466065 [Gossypium arboreum]
MEEVRPMEEYLQVIPLELDIMKQKFKRKNLELEKKIEKLEDKKMYLSLDIDLQKKEVEKVRKEKRKVEEDRDDLKEEYKKTQVSLKRVGLERSSEQWQKEVQVEKARAEYWETKFQEMRSQNLQLETQEDCIKGELHQVKGQVRDRDYVIREAIAQIREIAEYV